MVKKILVGNTRAVYNKTVFEDTNDGIDTTGILTNSELYDTGTFLDRDYDVRSLSGFIIALENLGLNDLKYTVLSTSKSPNADMSNIGDDDFDTVEVAEANVPERSKPTGSVELLTGASGSVNSIKVDGVEILSAAVPFNTSLAQTATDVAANITAFDSNPNYTASAVGGVITITAPDYGPSSFVVISTTTTITKADTNMSGGNSGKPSVYELIRNSPKVAVIRLRVKSAVAAQHGTMRSDIRGF